MVRASTQDRLNRQHGFTLLEVLITVLILSIGLLGLASLQTKGLQYNYSANLRSQATLLAYDMLDRMRANRNASIAGLYNINLGDSVTASNCTGSGADCTPANMATFDKYEWKTELADRLPKGNGEVESTALAGTARQVTITVEWSDNREKITNSGSPVPAEKPQFKLRTVL